MSDPPVTMEKQLMVCLLEVGFINKTEDKGGTAGRNVKNFAPVPNLRVAGFLYYMGNKEPSD